MSELGPYVPEDFDEFWAELVGEARAQPLDFRRSLHNDYPLDGFVVEQLRFRGAGGTPLDGWLAYPEGARRLPGFLWIPPYGRESMLPNEYGSRKGFVSFSFNLHGLPAFHQEAYIPERGYFAEGASSPHTWVFRTLVQHCLIAARVLEAQIEVDEDRIGAMGMSQGGGLAIWVAAFSPIVKAVCADMPFLGGMRRTLSGNAYRYPLKELFDFMETEPLGREKLLWTVGYFDTVNVATRCHKPTLVSRGLKDPSVRPDTAQAIYDALPGEKRLVTYDWGHDWHPEMVSNNRNWLVDWLG